MAGFIVLDNYNSKAAEPQHRSPVSQVNCGRACSFSCLVSDNFSPPRLSDKNGQSSAFTDGSLLEAVGGVAHPAAFHCFSGLPGRSVTLGTNPALAVAEHRDERRKDGLC